MKDRTRKAVGEAFGLATLLTSLLVAAQVSFTAQAINEVETAAVFFSFACTWLCTRQVRFNYVLGVISTVLLSYTFWQAELYGSMALNLYLIPTVIYGWFIWKKDTETKIVQHVQLRMLALYGLFTALTWYGAYTLITQFDGALGALDGWLLAGSILAQFLLDRKKIETWFVWAAVNVVSVYVYFESGLYLLAAQFLLFLLNAGYAWWQWRKTLDRPVAALPVEVQPALRVA